jgi:hypothetical protein
MSSKQPAALPTSLRLNKEVIAHFNALQKGPRKRGFHPSGLPKLCPVKHYLYEEAIQNFASPDPVVIQEAMRRVRAILDTVHDGVSPNRLPSRLEPDFHVGDAIHEFLQWSLGLRGYLWGKWECPHCRAVTGWGTMPRTNVCDVGGNNIAIAAPCQNCQGRNRGHKTIHWRYVEPWAGDREWGQEGHTDGLMIKPHRGNDIKAILEIKSINENGYKGRYGDPLPRQDHIEQASQYAWAARTVYPELFSDLEHVYFIYVNKNAVREWKEFLVPADRTVMDRMQEKMRTVIEAHEKGQPPIHARACPTIQHKQARTCPMVEECFGEKPPANFFDPQSFTFEEMPL